VAETRPNPEIDRQNRLGLLARPTLTLLGFCLVNITGLWAVSVLWSDPAHAPAVLLTSAQQPSNPNQNQGNESSNSPSDRSIAGTQPLQPEDVIARDVLAPLQAAIQTRNLMKALAVFDPQSTASYPEIRDQLRALFNNYSVLLFRYKLLQLNSENGRASVICEVDLDATPEDDTLMAIRRSTQMRVQLKQTHKGWKIAAFTPSDFFAQ